MRSKWLIVILAALYIFIVFDRKGNWTTNNSVLKSDKFGYYTYLPATFIYNDLSSLHHYEAILPVYKFIYTDPLQGMYKQPNGSMLNKYAIGVSCFELPFFFAAHVYTLVCSGYPADGYSLPYQWAMYISNIFWAIIGLCFLRAFLMRFFSDNITTITLLCMGLGTNFYYYTAFDPGMSHVYSFTLISALLYFTDKWHADYQSKHLYAIAITLGFITITRPVNLSAIIFPLLWKVDNIAALKQKLARLSKNYTTLIIAVICFMVMALIQMSYWKYITGHWIHYSYEEEIFYFSNPHVLDGLFSFRKGWFIYTPLAFIGVVGLYSLYKKNKGLLLAPAATLTVMIYICFSWYMWWYGGSLGCRVLIDALPIVALPFAATVEAGSRFKHLLLKPALALVLIFFILLNIFQTYQYNHGILHFDRMTSAYYWRIFGKLNVSESDRQLLMSDEEYWQKMGEILK